MEKDYLPNEKYSEEYMDSLQIPYVFLRLLCGYYDRVQVVSE